MTTQPSTTAGGSATASVDPVPQSAAGPQLGAPPPGRPSSGRLRSLLERSRFARAASGTFLLRLTSRALALPSGVLLARLLGPAGYGKYGYALAWATILGTPAVLGMDRYLVRAVALYQTEGRFDLIRGIVRWANWTVLWVSAAMALIGAAAGFLFVPTAFTTSYWLGLLMVVPIALTLVRQGVLQGLMHVELAFIPEQLVFPGLFLAFIAAIWASGQRHLSAPTAIVLYIIAAVAAFLLGIVLMRRHIPNEVKATQPRTEGRYWFRTAMPFTVINIITALGAQIGIILLGSFGLAHAAGLFSLASSLVVVPVFLLAAINAPLAPLTSRLHARGDFHELQAVATRTARASVIFSVPAIAAMYLFRHPLLELIGGGFQNGAGPLAILLAGQLINSAAGPVAVVLLMSGYEKVTAVGMGLGLVASAAISAVLIPFLGADGAALGRTIGLAVWNILLAVVTYRILGINATVLPWPRPRQPESGPLSERDGARLRADPASRAVMASPGAGAATAGSVPQLRRLPPRLGLPPTGRRIAAFALTAGLLVIAVAGLGWATAHGDAKFMFGLLAAAGLCALAVSQRGAFIGVLVLLCTSAFPFIDASTVLVHGLRVQDVAIGTLIVVAALWVISDREQPERTKSARMLATVGALLLAWWLVTLTRSMVSGGVPATQAAGFGRDFLYFGLLLVLLPRVRLSRRDLMMLGAVLGAGACAYATGQILKSTGVADLSWLVHASNTAQQLGLTRIYADATDLVAAALAMSAAAMLLSPGLAGRLAPAMTLLLGTSVLVQLGRARWIGLIVGFAAVLAWVLIRRPGAGRARTRKRLLAPVAILVIAAAVFLVGGSGNLLHSAISQRILSLFSTLGTGGGTVGYRDQLINTLFSILGGHWLIGLGFLPPSVHYFTALPNGSIRNADVGVTNAVMTMGVIGAAVIYWPMLRTLINCLRRPVERVRSEWEWVRYGGAVWIVATLVGSVTLTTLFSASGLTLTAVMLTVLIHPTVLTSLDQNTREDHATATAGQSTAEDHATATAGQNTTEDHGTATAVSNGGDPAVGAPPPQ